MADLKKKILMKIHRIEYSYVFPEEEYESTEKVYRKIKKNLEKLATSINNLLTYEHGGSTMKKFYSGLHTISSASKVNYFNNHDIYEAFAAVNCELADIEMDSGINKVTSKAEKAFLEISEAKNKFNAQCQEEINVLERLKKKSAEIDKVRDNVKVYRYDLEKLKQSNPKDMSEVNKIEALYKENSNKALEDMKEFVGNQGLKGVLKNVMKYNAEFFSSGVESLKRDLRGLKEGGSSLQDLDEMAARWMTSGVSDRYKVAGI